MVHDSCLSKKLSYGELEEGREFEIMEIIIKMKNFKEQSWKSVET